MDKNDMREIKSDMKTVIKQIARIEQHLSDMNGKLVTVTDHVNNKCPKFRSVQNRLIYITMGGILLLGFILSLIIPPVLSAILK